MRYNFYLDINADTQLAKALKGRVESPELGAATRFFHHGVLYSITSEGVYVSVDDYATEIPEAYKGIVRKITFKAYLPPNEATPATGTYKRAHATAVVDTYSERGGLVTTIMVEGTELARVNRLMHDIRSGKANRAHRAKWGARPSSQQ